MSGPTPRFDPRELDGADRPFDDDDAAGLTALARELEALGGTTGTPLAAGFEDQVMAALAIEPTPVPIARGWSIVALLAMTRDAWRLATTGPRPLAVRVQALALVLLVAIAGLSLGSVAVVGAARWLGSDDASTLPVRPIPSATPAVPSPSASPSPSLQPSPSPSASPSPSPTPSASPDPTGTAEPTDTAEPTPTAEATEPTRTPRPTDTPHPTETLDPDDTPEPTGTEDHSGPGGGGSDDGGDDSGPGGGG